MRNNIQNDVKVENARNYKSKFDLSGSVSNTLSIGRVGVSFSRQLRPGTKAMCGAEQLLWLNALVRPVYAKQKYKNWHMFVPISDVFPNYDAMMAREPINRNGTVFTPTDVPTIPSRCLSAIALNGARCSIYVRKIDGNNDNQDIVDHFPSTEVCFGVYQSAIATDDYSKVIDAALSGIWSLRSDGSPRFDIGALLDLPLFFDNTQQFIIESGNIDKSSFCKYSGSSEIDYKTSLSGYDHKNTVSLESADQLIYRQLNDVDGQQNNNYLVVYAFRYSSWGQAFVKNIRALGYDVNLDESTNVSLLPLFATYKAYWDIFGLNLWQNWETTACARVIEIITNFTSAPWNAWTSNNSAGWNAFKSFMFDEFGSMWLTEQNDYISAHLPQPTISSGAPSKLANASDVDGWLGRSVALNSDTRGQSAAQPDITLPDGHAKTTSVLHGALDSEVLKRLYKWTNRNTVLGRKIADLMRAQGLGRYMERTRVNYIGDTSVELDVHRVTSQSDTFNEATGEGAVLGQYAGNGVGYKPRNKKLYYETDCEGYWICLEAVTCDAGYSQGFGVEAYATNSDDFYRPDFDALGLVQSPKSLLNGSKNTSIARLMAVNENLSKFDASQIPFGYIPRFANWKVGRNCINGGFLFRSTRNVYLPFNMDKVMFPDDAVTRPVDSNLWDTNHFPIGWKNTNAGELHYLHRTFPISDMPIAGNSWRFLNRFPWLANLNRIFVNFGDDRGALTWSNQNLGTLAKYFEYHYLTDDNYILLNDVWFKAWCGMLPIEETYGTIDPDKKELEYVEKV